MRLSEIKGTDAIDVIADIIDPVTVILADKEIQEAIETKKPYLLIAKTILKNQKEAILEVLAVLHKEDPKEFKPSLIELPIMLVQLVQDVMDNKELVDLFQLQGVKTASVSSFPAMQNTEGTETM
jgi:hypothetical protein